jgi:hypothetical protein
MIVVEELYKEAVVGTDRNLIIFNGELDRIRSGCIFFLNLELLFRFQKTFSFCVEFIYFCINFTASKI